MGQKASDRNAIPLCHAHHKGGNESYHALGPVRFAEKHDLNILNIVAKLNDQGLLFESPHAVGRKERSPGFTRYHCPCGWRSGWYAGEHDALFVVQRHVEEKNDVSLETGLGDGSAIVASAADGSHGGTE